MQTSQLFYLPLAPAFFLILVLFLRLLDHIHRSSGGPVCLYSARRQLTHAFVSPVSVAPAKLLQSPSRRNSQSSTGVWSSRRILRHAISSASGGRIVQHDYRRECRRRAHSGDRVLLLAQQI